MPKRIEFDGEIHEFPDDFTDQDISAALQDHAPAPAKPSESLLHKAAAPVLWAANKVDSYTGAPLRAGLGAAMDVATSDLDKSTLAQLPEGFGHFAQAFGSQFGQDPNKAPTSESLFERAGLSNLPQQTVAFGYPGGQNPAMTGGNFPSPAGMAGFALDAATPVPGLGELKGVGAVGMHMAETTGKGGVKAAAKGMEYAAKAADAATGTQAATKALGAAKTGLQSAQDGFDNLAKALKSRYGTALAPDAPKAIQVAAKNGIDPNLLPEAVMFGPQSSASRLARAEAESPFGQAIRDRHRAAHVAVQDAIRSDIRKIAGEAKDPAGNVVKEAEIPANAYEAGDLIKSAYDKRVDDILGNLDVTYKSVIESGANQAKIPQAAMAKLNDRLSALEKEAMDMGVDAFDPTTEAQAKHLLQVVGKVRNAGDNLSAVTRGLQGLGRTAFKTKTPLGMVPPDVRKLRSLYGDLAETVNAGVESSFGKQAADQLRANNKTVTELFGDKALLPSLGDAAKSEDKLFRSLVLDGDAKRINALKKYLTPEELQKVKAAALNTLLKENPQGEFTFRQLHNRLGNKTDALNALFDPGELDNMRDLIQLGDKLGPAELSTSGTGGSLAHQSAAWSDWLRPTKLADKAEKTADKVAKTRQKKAVTRAIGFETPPSLRSAAQGSPRPPTMGFGPAIDLRTLVNGGPAFRKKALQIISAQQGDD